MLRILVFFIEFEGAKKLDVHEFLVEPVEEHEVCNMSLIFRYRECWIFLSGF